MPPHLHPRSRLTSSLFATTLLASFLVVGLPHVIPCPAPRIAYADSEMDTEGVPKRRKRRRNCPNAARSGNEGLDGTKELDDRLIAGVEETQLRRECPVPKPSGILGEILGFKSDSRDGKGPKQPP